MSINYLEIKRSAALRLAQIAGTDQATLEASYTGSWASMLDGAEIPISGFKDAILSIERELVQMIGNNAQHPARSLLYGRSSSLSDLDETPTQDQTGAEFFGVFDSCADATDNKPCTWQPTQTIADINQSFFDDTDFYYYNINGNYIRSTRPTVFLQGVAWSYTAQETAYDADQDSPLPQGLTPVWLDGITARAAQVGWVAGDIFAYYNNLYQIGRQNFNTIGQTPNLPLTAAANPAAG